jgi:hypothetical protein
VKTITITAAAAHAIRAAAQFEFYETGYHNPDGTYTVPISNEVLFRLTQLSNEWGLSISDTILHALNEKPPQ